MIFSDSDQAKDLLNRTRDLGTTSPIDKAAMKNVSSKLTSWRKKVEKTADEKLTGYIQGKLGTGYQYSSKTKWFIIHIKPGHTFPREINILEKGLPRYLKRLVKDHPPEEIEASRRGANADIWSDFYKD